MFLFLATDHGLIAFMREGADWHETARGLAGRQVTSVIAREGVILAGTTDGVFRSDDLGWIWQDARRGLAPSPVRRMADHPGTSRIEFARTQPGAIFVSPH